MKNLYSENYNSLQDVLIADEELTQIGRDDVLDPLLEIISKHKLQDVVGLRLLHNHNQISTDEIMLELEEINSNENCLTTKAIKISEVKEGYYPNSWALDSTLIPLEYSADSSVKYNSHLILNNEGFIEEFKIELDKLGVRHLIGLYILNREFFIKGIPGESADYNLVESTDADRRANILKFKKSCEIDRANYIDTVWAAQSKEITMGCERVKVGCPKIPIVICSSGDDGHVRNTRYEHGADYEHTFKP